MSFAVRVAAWRCGAITGIRATRCASCASAALDERDRLAPDIHIFTATKQPWVVLGADVPAVEEYYECEDYWPEDSLARQRAYS